MLDRSARNLTGLRLVYYNGREQSLVLLKFASQATYGTTQLVTFSHPVMEVACSDDFTGDLLCAVTRQSGEICTITIPTNATARMTCNIEQYYDFTVETVQVIGSLILASGRLLTANKRFVLVYDATATNRPVYVSGALDLTDMDDVGDIFVVATSVFATPGVIVRSGNRVTVNDIKRLTMHLPSGIPTQVADSHVVHQRCKTRASPARRFRDQDTYH